MKNSPNNLWNTKENIKYKLCFSIIIYKPVQTV